MNSDSTQNNTASKAEENDKTSKTKNEPKSKGSDKDKAPEKKSKKKLSLKITVIDFINTLSKQGPDAFAQEVLSARMIEDKIPEDTLKTREEWEQYYIRCNREQSDTV